MTNVSILGIEGSLQDSVISNMLTLELLLSAVWHWGINMLLWQDLLCNTMLYLCITVVHYLTTWMAAQFVIVFSFINYLATKFCGYEEDFFLF